MVGPGSSANAESPTFAEDVQGDRAYVGTRLRHAGRVRYQHDAQGRLVLRQQKRLSGPPRTWRYSWDADDRLAGVVTPDGQRWVYRYDAFGRRVAKQRVEFDGRVLDETVYTWDGTHLAETSTDGFRQVVAWEWEPGSHRPLAQLERSGIDGPFVAGRDDGAAPAGETDQDWYDTRFYAIVTDLVGAPTGLLDPSGTLVWQRRASLWGVSLVGGPVDDHGKVDCPLRFPGQYHDPETGLDYNYHRHYDPATARYQSVDPLGLAPAPNPVSYVRNPLVWVDPLGLAEV